MIHIVNALLPLSRCQTPAPDNKPFGEAPGTPGEVGSSATQKLLSPSKFNSCFVAEDWLPSSELSETRIHFPIISAFAGSFRVKSNSSVLRRQPEIKSKTATKTQPSTAPRWQALAVACRCGMAFTFSNTDSVP